MTQPSPWTIRPTELDDIESMRRMQAASWLHAYPNPARGVSEQWVVHVTDNWFTAEGLAGSREHFRPIFRSQNHLHVIAETEAEGVIGLLHCSRSEGVQHFDALYIDAQYYGTGLAQDLMDRAGAWLDPQKVTKLEVVSYNARAIAFYEKYGYRTVPGSEALFKEHLPIITMQTTPQKEPLS